MIGGEERASRDGGCDAATGRASTRASSVVRECVMTSDGRTDGRTVPNASLGDGGRRRAVLAWPGQLRTLKWAAPGVAITLVLGVRQLLLPNVLFGIHAYTGNGYDDGVYLGSAIRLVHGTLPYRDFVLVHPPGIALLMTPLAAVSSLIGARDALAGARVLTIMVAASNAGLASRAVRHKGPFAMLVAGISLALFPLAATADQTLLLEPYLVLFCLLGTVVALPDGELAGSRRLAWGGALFGFAGLIKVWAIFPVMALVAVVAIRRRRALQPLTLGLVYGFGVPALPFLLLSPRGFMHDVVLAQVGRGSTGRAALSIGDRLLMITGVSGLPSLHSSPNVGILLATSIAAVVSVAYAIGRRRATLDWFVAGGSVLIVVSLFQPPEFFDHYSYFSAGMLVLVFGVAAGSAAEAVSSWSASQSRHTRQLALGTLIALAAMASVPLVRDELRFTRTYLRPADDPGGQLARAVPDGSCVTFDVATLAVIADRFTGRGDCAPVVDTFGTWFLENDGQPPPSAPRFRDAFVAKWKDWLSQSDTVLMSVRYSNFIPWTPELVAWFNARFTETYALPHVIVYTRTR